MNPKTKYEVGSIPHAEHPQPQMQRDTWLCLNGRWKLAKRDASGVQSDVGEILVPFSPETKNSGIEEEFVLKSGEMLIYQRNFDVSEALLQGKLLLHF